MSSRVKSSNDFNKSRRKDSRSRSRNRSRDRSRDRHRSREKDKDKRSNRWTDAPSMSRFSNTPNNIENNKSSFHNSNQNNYPTKPTATYGNGSNVNPNILFTLNDNTKIKRKIYIPKVSGVNFVGLLIGPKGSYQKRLEQQSSCKILIRGKGTQKDGMPPQADDNEEQHVLIVGETEENVNRAKYLIEKVIYSDDNTRNKIKEEQLKASKEMRTELFLSVTDSTGKPIPQEIEDYLMTPYGPPDRNARILPVPNDCVGLIIGKNGETIRRLHRETGCKIQIAKKEIPNTDVRNVFIEGNPEKYEIAKRLIEEIIAEQIFLKQNFSHLGEINPFPGPHTLLRIPNKMVGLIIGKNGETVKTIHQKTGCYIFIPKESRPGEDYRELELSGAPESVEICKREIISMIHMALYGRLPYQNSIFYPFIDPVTGLPIIDPGIMAQLDPNSKKGQSDTQENSDLPTPMQSNDQTNLTLNNTNKEENNSYEMSTNNLDNLLPKEQNILILSANSPEKKEKSQRKDSDKKNIASDQNKNNINNLNYDNKVYKQQCYLMQNLDYKYAPQNINSNYIMQQPAQNYNAFDLNNYNIYDYNDQSNYDLYYQSLYQMYPQMSDYYKKTTESSVQTKGVGQQTPFVLFNTSLLEENNTVYDPSMINTNLLDVNFQNKFAFSTAEYFDGKMFEQNYTNIDQTPNNSLTTNIHNFPELDNQVSNIKPNNENRNSNDNIDVSFFNSNDVISSANTLIENNNAVNHQTQQKYEDDETFKIPENINKLNEGLRAEKPKRKSRFDQ